MTAKHILIRYLKDNGYFHYILSKEALFNAPAESIFWSLKLCIEDANFMFKDSTFYSAMTKLIGEMHGLKTGDKLMLCTQDGKYEYEYTFLNMLDDFESFIDTDRNIHKLDRITMINGKRVDGKKGFFKYKKRYRECPKITTRC